MGRCQQFNLVALGGEVLETYGNLDRERGDAARATEFYVRAVRAYEEAGRDPSRIEVQEEHALLHLQTGHLPTARAMLDRLIEVRSSAGHARARRACRREGRA